VTTEYVPTADQRALVENAAAFGITQADIAEQLKIDEKTLRTSRSVNDVSGNHALKLNLIRGLEANIVKNRKRLAKIDAQLCDIATTHLSNVPGASEKPYEVAKRVIEESPFYDWFTDRPYQPFGGTEIGESMVAALAAAIHSSR
jgi:hypothetical protein